MTALLTAYVLMWPVLKGILIIGRGLPGDEEGPRGGPPGHLIEQPPQHDARHPGTGAAGVVMQGAGAGDGSRHHPGGAAVPAQGAIQGREWCRLRAPSSRRRGTARTTRPASAALRSRPPHR